jgi:lipopolysaccharide biosynthesis glycosyltransferase
MKTAIALCVDSEYAEHAAVLIDSLSENYHYRQELAVVCIVPEGDSKAFETIKTLTNIEACLALELVVVPDSEYGWLKELKWSKDVGIIQVNHVNWSKSIPATLWYRLFLGSLLPDYDRAIYMDLDMLVVRDIAPLINYPQFAPLLATYDTVGVPYLYNLHQGELSHFISGLLIMDLNWWRTSGIEESFKKDLLQNGPHELLDEYLLNKYCLPHWHPLPVTFNFVSYSYNKYGVPNWDSSYLPKAIFKHAIVMHFAGPIKPWNAEEVAGGDNSEIGAEWRRRRALLFTEREPKGLGEQ